MAKFQINGTVKWIFNHLIIIGSIISGIILVGRWIESTKGSIVSLQKITAKVESKVEKEIIPEVTEHDKKVELLEKDITYIKTGQDELKDMVGHIDKNLERHINRDKTPNQ